MSLTITGPGLGGISSTGGMLVSSSVCQCCKNDDYIALVEKRAMAYAGRPQDLVEALHDVQSIRNYLPREAIVTVARVLGVPVTKVYGVATFYSMFSIEPRGRHIIRVCESAPCHVMGADSIVEMLMRELGVDIGETTSDGRYTLELTSCLGVCGVAPAIMIDDTVHGNLKPGDIPGILKQYS